MSVAFGVDPSGYSTAATGFACARSNARGDLTVFVFGDHPLAVKKRGDAELANILALERDLLSACLRIGEVFIDVPLDLQGLPLVPEPKWIWQLTQRPIDYAVGAKSPLADRLGAPISRILNVIRHLDGHGGERVFETYPAASFRLIKCESKKGEAPSAIFDGVCWKRAAESSDYVVDLANRFNLRPNEKCTLTGDEIDAAICALTGVADEGHRLQGTDLSNWMRVRLSEKLGKGSLANLPLSPPTNYVLLHSWHNRPVELRFIKFRDTAALERLVS